MKLAICLRYSFICLNLNQETAKKSFGFSSEAVTCFYQSNHAKVEAILLSALPKDTTSELAGLPSHYPFFMLWTSSRETVNQGRRQKNFQRGRGQREKLDRKIAPLSFPLLFQSHLWKSRGARLLPVPCFRRSCCKYKLFKSFGLTRPGNRTQVYRLLAQK